MRLLFFSSEKCRATLHYHYSQVHSVLELCYLSGFYQWVKWIRLKGSWTTFALKTSVLQINIKYLALLTNTLAQAKCLLHSLKQAARGISFKVNSDKTEFMCFNQDGAISILNGGLMVKAKVNFKAPDCGIVIREFEQQSRYYVHF